jgi:hypothetical protein
VVTQAMKDTQEGDVMDMKDKIMNSLQISSSEKTFYYYKTHRYENLKDAINYAELERKEMDKKPSPLART